MLEAELCSAFCQGIKVRNVPVGYAISTGFRTSDGDSIGFYAVRLSDKSKFRLEDDGTIVPMLEAIGIAITGTREKAFQSLLDEYGCLFSPKTQLIFSREFDEKEIANESINFLALLLRIQDLELLSPRIVESTFKEDALQAIRERFGKRVQIAEETSLTPDFQHYMVDSIFIENAKSIAAIYIGTSAARVDEAVMLHMEMNLRRQDAGKVILLLETARPQMPDRTLARAHNHLDAIPVFRGSEQEAMNKIESTIFSGYQVVH